MTILFKHKAFDLFLTNENLICVDTPQSNDFFLLSKDEIDALIIALQNAKQINQNAAQ